MTVTLDSRQTGGTLTVNALAFDHQTFTCELVPNVVEEGDELEMLNGNKLSADERTEWALNVGVVQDFDDPDGFLEFCRANAGDVVPFSWEPNNVDAPTYVGTLKVRAVRIGGATRVRLTSDVSFPVVELTSATYPA